jgi:ATP-dependent DNA helicase RecG
VRDTRNEDYPKPALTQAIANAVMHRDYLGSHAPVRIAWFDDRIEIVSPGGPYGAASGSAFGQPGVTDYRNPGLAAALKDMGYVQRFGYGIPTIRKEMERNGNPPPEFDVGDASVKVVLRRAAS